MAICIHNLTVGYDRHPAVHHVTCTHAEGSLTALIGPNGGGKSTLLKAMMGFLPLSSGHIDCGGIRHDQIAYLPQQLEIDRSFPISVLDAVQMGHWQRCGAFGGLKRADTHRTMLALQTVGMAAFARRPIGHLSSGQFQRLLFARIILQDARLILLDEPFANIDSRTVTDLMPLVQQWHQEGRTVMIVLHDLEQVQNYFPQALLLARELISFGLTDQVLQPNNLTRARMLAESWQEQAAECHVDVPDHPHHHGHAHQHKDAP
jgi:zinc/manganese transport system ATP-binding protein